MIPNLTICPRCRLNVCPASLALGNFLSVITCVSGWTAHPGASPHPALTARVGMGCRPVSSSPGYLQCVVQGWLHDQEEIRLFFEIYPMDVGGRESLFFSAPELERPCSCLWASFLAAQRTALQKEKMRPTYKDKPDRQRWKTDRSKNPENSKSLDLAMLNLVYPCIFQMTLPPILSLA